jgi:hypothetical protein
MGMPLEQFSRDIGHYNKLARTTLNRDFEIVIDNIVKLDVIEVGDIVYHKVYGYNVLGFVEVNSQGGKCNVFSYAGEYKNEEEIPFLLE